MKNFAYALSQKVRLDRSPLLALTLGLGTLAASAETVTNGVVAVTPGAALPEVGLSLVRVLGALAFVLALFLGGVWVFRNWQRITVQRGRAPQLQVIEMKSLGNRQAIVVVAFQQQRMLLASSPTGVTFLSHLPASEAGEGSAAPTATPTFADALQQVLGRKS